MYLQLSPPYAKSRKQRPGPLEKLEGEGARPIQRAGRRTLAIAEPTTEKQTLPMQHDCAHRKRSLQPILNNHAAHQWAACSGTRSRRALEHREHPLDLLLQDGVLGLEVAHLGSGRIVASEKEAPNMLMNLV
jgi:hypothetical protein